MKPVNPFYWQCVVCDTKFSTLTSPPLDLVCSKCKKTKEDEHGKEESTQEATQTEASGEVR